MSNNKPRPQGTGIKPPTMNAPRPPAPGPNNLSAKDMQRLSTIIGAGPGKMHERSVNELHERRAYVYDSMSKNAVTKRIRNAKDSAISAVSKVTPDFMQPTLNLSQKKELRHDAKNLKPYKKEMKERDPRAAAAETVGKDLKNVKTAATWTNRVGTVVSVVNPAAGAATKLAAKGVGIAAGLGAAASFNEASNLYKQGVDDNATGREVFGSHIAAEKGDLMQVKRNKLLASTAVGAVFNGAGAIVDSAMDGADKIASSIASGSNDVLKKGSKTLAKYSFEQQERMHKSEIVGLMEHQQSYDRRAALTARLRSDAPINPMPDKPATKAPKPPRGSVGDQLRGAKTAASEFVNERVQTYKTAVPGIASNTSKQLAQGAVSTAQGAANIVTTAAKRGAHDVQSAFKK